MSLKTIPELLSTLGAKKALCAFNVENLETLKAAIHAAAEVDVPVVIEMTTPAAERFELAACRALCETYARLYGADVALHLDHCDDIDAFEAAINAGFTSGNFLGEGMSGDAYIEGCKSLRRRYGGLCSFEFVYGELGYMDGHTHDSSNHVGHRSDGTFNEPDLHKIENFVKETQPDLFSFDFGSLHGMQTRDRDLEISLLRDVVAAVDRPVVLHGSSGVRQEQILASIDVGVRKINVESAIRKRHTDAVKSFIETGKNVGKPRYLSAATEHAVHDLYVELLVMYTLRPDVAE